MANAGQVNRALLSSFYQNAGDTYDDNKTEGAIGVIADQVDANFSDYAMTVNAGALSKLGIINVKDYKAAGSAQTTTGSIISGSATLTLAASLDFSNGQGITVAGAGAAGALLVTTIVSGAGTTILTLAANAGTTVAAAAVGHDDYAALNTLFNTTLSTAAAVVIPAGTYILNTNLTIPSYIHLKMLNGAKLSPAASKTVTINGMIEAGIYQIFAGSGSIAGTSKVREIYPEWFGAKGDGATNDQAAIQAAIGFYSTSSDGGIIKFSVFLYIITSALAITSKRDLVFLGVSANGGTGKGTIIRQTTDNTNVIVLNGAKGIIFKDMRIERTSTLTGTGDCLQLTNQTSDCRFHDCWFAEGYRNLFTDFSSQNYFFGCYFYGPSSVNVRTDTASGASDDQKFMGCSFWLYAGCGATLNFHNRSNTVYIANCGFESYAATSDLWVEYGDDCSIVNCKSIYRGILIDQNANRMLVEGCQIYNTPSDGISNKGVDSRIIGNDIRNTTGSGIYNQYGTKATVMGNKIKNSHDAFGGAIVIADMTDCVVIGNTCYDDQGTKTQRYGVITSGTSDYNIIVGNACRNNKLGSTSLVGANNQTANNL